MPNTNNNYMGNHHSGYHRILITCMHAWDLESISLLKQKIAYCGGGVKTIILLCIATIATINEADDEGNFPDVIANPSPVLMTTITEESK